MVRALASHHCCPGSNPGVDAICGLSLLLVLSLALRGFSPGTPFFPSPQKPTFPNYNSTRNQVDEEPLCRCAASKSLYVILSFFLFITVGNFYNVLKKKKKTKIKTNKQKKIPMGNKRLFDQDNLTPNFPFFSFYAFRAYTVNP